MHRAHATTGEPHSLVAGSRTGSARRWNRDHQLRQVGSAQRSRARPECSVAQSAARAGGPGVRSGDFSSARVAGFSSWRRLRSTGKWTAHTRRRLADLTQPPEHGFGRTRPLCPPDNSPMICRPVTVRFRTLPLWRLRNAVGVLGISNSSCGIGRATCATLCHRNVREGNNSHYARATTQHSHPIVHG